MKSAVFYEKNDLKTDKKVKVLLFGEVLWDIIDNKEYIGGAPFNVAVNLKKLGAEVCFLSRVGADELGDKAINKARAFGMNTENIQRDEKNQTGVAICKIQPDGSAVYEFPENVAYNEIEYPKNPSIIDDYDIFYFGTMVQMAEKAKETLHKILDNHKFKNVFLDVNIRREFYPKDVLEYSFSKSSILKLNDEEAEKISLLLFGEFESYEAFARKISEKYDIKLILITKGGDGCGIFGDGRYEEFAVKKADVCDTIGAGDAFSAGFINFYSLTGDIKIAGEKAGILGTYVASNVSALPEYNEELKNKLSIVMKKL